MVSTGNAETTTVPLYRAAPLRRGQPTRQVLAVPFFFTT